MKDIIDKFKESFREFSLTSLAVDNGTSIFILTFMILLFGINSYMTMPKESYPEIPWPQKYVQTVYFGNSAEDIEDLITRPLEKEIASISGIKKITSSSRQDFSIVIAEFNADVDSDLAVQKIKDAIDRAKPELPTDLTQDPEVLDVNLADLPIMTVNLAGNFSNDELDGYAEYLKEKIKDLREINDVDIKGIMDREVSIEVDLPRMEILQVSFGDIENAIRSENITMSGGEIVANDFRRTISIKGQLKSIKEFENLIVKSENQRPIYLRDIAKVKFGFQERSSIARADQEAVVSLDILKKKGENLLDASDKIKLAVEEAKASGFFPENLKVTLFNDQSVETRNLVSNLQNSIISGVILVVLVLLFFLGIRNALFVGMAIPLSLLMGILIINTIGYTLNMVVLFSLILALGLLVDNAIVVVENIFRYRQNGYSSTDSSKYGAGEVAMPIIASTATTLAAFLPLAFWPGLIGEFMKYLPITLIIVLSSSLFVALVINPVFTSALMKVDERSEDAATRRRKVKNVLLFALLGILIALLGHLMKVMWLRNIMSIVVGVTLVNFFLLRPASFFFQDKILPILENGYNKFIRFALRKYNPFFFFLGSVALLFMAFDLMSKSDAKSVLFPVADPLYINCFVEMPIGKDIVATDKVLEVMEDRVEEVIKPYRGIVEAMLTQIGENTSDPNGEREFGASPHKARLTVTFIPSSERGGLSTTKIMGEIRAAMKDVAPGAQITVAKNADGPPTGRDINIELSGEDVEQLALISEDMISFINKRNIPGIEELKKDITLSKPELIVNVNREAARRYEISTFAIADAIRTSVFGKEISKYKIGDEDYPINLRLNNDYRYDVNEILSQKITFRSPANGRISQVPISSVADVEFSSTYTAINRKDQERMVQIYSNVLSSSNANEVVADIKDALAEYEFPEGYTWSFTGSQEQQEEEMAFLAKALGIAVFAILLIIVAQFNSIVSPVIILMAVIFSLIGVFFGYILSGRDFVIIMTGVGIISLAGIVVNNAIVLIDYIELLIKRKRQEKGVKSTNDLNKEDVRDAIISGGGTRLRPVLLTAITTVLGLVPLAIGFNFDFFGLVMEWDPNIYMGGDNAMFWGPMAWTVIYGLVFSTFLTLVVVPAMYWMAYLGKSALMPKTGGSELKKDTIIEVAE